MKLSNLYTEGQLSETQNPFKGLLQRASKVFSRAKQTPHPSHARIKRIIREIHQEVWGDYYDDLKARARIDAYKNSIERHIPYFLNIDDEEMLKQEIETMFRARAERMVPQDFGART